MDGIDRVSASSPSHYPMGRYETALLCVGVLHSYFGHSKLALEVGYQKSSLGPLICGQWFDCLLIIFLVIFRP